jgi:hypothetical protein
MRREAQGIVPMPYTISLKRTKARRGFFRVAGVINVAGTAPSGAGLVLFAAVKGGKFKKVASTRSRRGKYVFNRRLPKKTSYVFVERPPTLAACASPLVPCTAAIVSNAISRVVKIGPPKRR